MIVGYLILIFLTSSHGQYESQPVSVPKYLKKKYSLLGNFSDTKSKYPGKSDWTPPPGLFNDPEIKATYAGGCTGEPVAPEFVNIRCSMHSGCRAVCQRRYKFPKGASELFLTCKNNTWVMQGSDWTTIPPCEPICFPPCLNKGICIKPNQCNCPDQFSGAQCQFDNRPCLNFPPAPVNAGRLCNSKTCTITCLPNHQFPDGSSIATLNCKNSNWVPAKADWVSIPDCRAICNPPCENNGVCLAFNVCQCPQHFRGSQCQYSVDACSAQKLNFNGGYNCRGDGDSYSCTISCPAGMTFSSPPAPSYTCTYETGVFLPSSIPQCNFENPTTLGQIFYHTSGPMVNLSVNGNQFLSKTQAPGKNPWGESDIIYITPSPREEFQLYEQNKPQPGICFSWGGSHYKTFDGKVFSFDSPCAYTLVGDAVDHTFDVVVKNNEECSANSANCYKIIVIHLQDRKYILQKTADGTLIFGTPKKILPIPTRVAGVRAEMSAHYIVISLDSVGATIKWDGQQFVQVEVKESLWNRTEGLCGRLDKDPSNDMVTKDGVVPRNIATLATSWQVQTIGDTCESVPNEEHTCGTWTKKGSKAHKAAEFCNKLLKDSRFSACHNVVNYANLLEACKWDFCSCKEKNPEVCPCETVNIYVRECKHKGVTSLAEWRDQKTCPIKCSGNRIYKTCGPAGGQKTCGAAVENNEDGDQCEEGCYCPVGTVYHESRCIAQEQCPCRLRGKDFQPGSKVAKDCNSCTCSGGKWICTEVTCNARCSAIGDPHYVTFDGKRFDFMGQCSYYLVKHANFTIEAENVACPGAISLAMNFPISISAGLPSCTKTVTIKISGQTIKLNQNQYVSVNGDEITKIPFSVVGITIRSISSIFLQVELPDGLRVWWDGVTRVYIDAPAKYKGTTMGLCGNFNNNQKDDFLTPEMDVEESVIPFANKWKTDEKCNDLPDTIKSHPCEINMHNKAMAEEHCRKIKLAPFIDCHWFVDPEPYYQDCLYDMCSCETELQRCLCPIISAYAQECALKGPKINWRNDIRDCGINCAGGQEYQICGNPCTRTCLDIQLNQPCDQQCVEGCNCPESQTLDERGECIPIGQCSCVHDGIEFPAGYKEIRPAKIGYDLCTCTNALWNCAPAAQEDVNEFPKTSDLKAKCETSKNMEFTTCEPVEPETCKNMHSPQLFSASICHAGCQCKEGFVLDSYSKKCVKPTECPCHHGGQSYGENSVVQNDCNTCTCKNGHWKCTDRVCAAQCSAWGDSHYKTFDGKLFDYQGECDYLLTKGNLGNDDSMYIYIQNIACGSLGVSCSKSMTVKIGTGSNQESMTLAKDKSLPSFATLKRLTVRQQGLFVIVEVPDLGVVVHWDKGTRIYVKLDPRWKNKVSGLCGNYNDNQMDDFQTPSAGFTEVSAKLFGDSWKLHTYCPESKEVQDTCAARPDRKVWAVKKCGVLKSSVFASCHSEVPVDDYLTRCIFDTCACDQGGDCECLCTALSAYAQECNNHGVPVKWRTQELCPMQCDERCATYSPCISTCPAETCDNLLMQNQLTTMCKEDNCVEGCAVKPCPSDKVYLNSSMLECVPKNICKIVCLELKGKIYYEGDLMEKDQCHSCYCSRGEKICKGQPCTTELPTTSPVTQVPKTAAVSCQGGWTNWINQDKKPIRKANRFKASDVEPLPDSLVLNEVGNETNKVYCNISQMVGIECRRVRDHKSVKDTELDVECSLEKGLICQSTQGGLQCEDFEIRVLCDCGELTATMIPSTTQKPQVTCNATHPNQEDLTDCQVFYQCVPGLQGFNLVEKTCGPDMFYNPNTQTCDFPANVIKIKPICAQPITTTTAVVTPTKCPLGQEYHKCALECKHMCLFHAHTIHINGHCLHNEECEDGCVFESKDTVCPSGKFWLNNQVCVSVEDCTCRSHKGDSVQPGTVYRESECEICQCINNFYSCDKSACTPTPTRTTPRTTTRKKTPKPTITTPSAVTPSVKCQDDNFIKLIDGDIPLSDDAFTASSTHNDDYLPKFARMNSTSGSRTWAPNALNKNQYLQINLGKKVPIFGIIVAGGPKYTEFVTSYNILYSPDGKTFYYMTDSNKNPQEFKGPENTATPAEQLFDVPIEAQALRIMPLTWYRYIALKIELIGCAEVVTQTPPTVTSPVPPPKPTITRPSTVTPPEKCKDNNFIDLIDGNHPLSDDAFSASSVYGTSYLPKYARMSSKLGSRCWAAGVNDQNQYLQINLGKQEPVFGVIMRASPIHNEYVTSYKVLYSPDGQTFSYVTDRNKQPQVFSGPTDTVSPVKQLFDIPVEAEILQIIPQTWYNHISLKVELIGCAEVVTQAPVSPSKPTITRPSTVTPPEKCKDDNFIGLIDGNHPLSDDAFSASSVYGTSYLPKYARMSSKLGSRCWAAGVNDQNQYLQINLGKQEPVFGVIMRASPIHNEYVTSYKVLYSPDGQTFSYVTDRNKQPQVFSGPTDTVSPVKQLFDIPVEAEILQIIPQTWYNHISLKVELIGCAEVVTQAPVSPSKPTITRPSTVTPPEKCKDDNFIDLIDGNHPLSDDAFSASSVYGTSYLPKYARMSSKLGSRCWAAGVNDQNQYLQINLGKQEPVFGVIMRASPIHNEYVTSYKVLYSPDGQTFSYVTDRNKQPQVFSGPTDTVSPVKQLFDIPVEAEILQIIPQTWYNHISLKVELIGCAELVTTVPTITTVKPPTCTDPMGVENGMMSDQQYTVSSEYSPEHDKKHLKLNQARGWKPITNSPTEWVQFDFLEPRNITGFVTQGSPDAWVTSYTVKYSHNGLDWNPILDETGAEQNFLGNYDSNSLRKNYFKIPIQSQYFKVIPKQWNTNIELKIEPEGCYVPYPAVTTTPTILSTTPSECNTCLDVQSSICHCQGTLWWDGDNCVPKAQCPCMVGHISYAVGTTYQKDDCSQCLCKLGGVSDCTAKSCPPCSQDLHSVVTTTCACVCKPCNSNEKLCRTSNICINETLWCNGVKDCPDDETNCEIRMTTERIAVTETVLPTGGIITPCPSPPICPDGYVVKVKESTKSYHRYKSSKTKATYLPVKGRKGGKPEKLSTSCKEYKCVPENEICSQAHCPPNHDVIYYGMKIGDCKEYYCEPRDAVCNVNGRTFNTFDKTEFKYDICNHILARDSIDNNWQITIKKTCTTICSRDLIIEHDDHKFVLHADLTVEYDGYKYTTEQTKRIGSESQFFTISRVGDSLRFSSNSYGFWIMWDKQANAKVGVVRKLLRQVDGLCGYFNEISRDDKRKQDGSIAKTTVEFGDSWAHPDQPAICETKACSSQLQNKAWDMCNEVKKQIFEPCASAVNVESFVSRCLQTACSCLESAQLNKTSQLDCKCTTLQTFVVDCLTANPDIELSDWRIPYDCPATCEAPSVHHDCYKKKCEPTCDTIHDPDACPKLPHVCFPGCYCPSGLVRNGDDCVPAPTCRDCECNVLPHLQYITFDETNFTINANCVYVMSRDILPKGSNDHIFQVLITNSPCEKGTDKMCVGKVTILHNGHKIHILRDAFQNKLKVIVDSERLVDFTTVKDWAKVQETAARHMKILLSGIQVEVSIYFPSLGVSVKAPSQIYASKLEGLCGDCDKNSDNDYKIPGGTLTDDVDEFGFAWLSDKVQGLSKETCRNEPPSNCTFPPVGEDPCQQLLDPNRFGQCHPLLDPTIFVDWCKNDVCADGPKSACTSIQNYATECAHLGLCINWRSNLCKAETCPQDQEFKTCGPSCPKTCDSIKQKSPKKCSNKPVEGCFCPDGKVLLNGTCVLETDCEVCDKEGHRAGDVWSPDLCTTCTCEGTNVKCQTEHCASTETICKQGFTPVEVVTNIEKCCSDYVCVPVPPPTTCEPLVPINCVEGQEMKPNTKPDGCQQYVCQCVPPEKCKPVNLTGSLEPGLVKVKNESGCCPVVDVICKLELCPAPKSCELYHNLKKTERPEKCCPEYSCEPPKDQCIVKLKYTADEKGGERLKTAYEESTVLKDGNATWKDGPCRDCNCIKTSTNYEPVCTPTNCPALSDSSDYKDYKLKEEPVFDQCCPAVKRVACIHDGKTYQVGEKWPQSLDDYCNTIECVADSNGIRKETQVATCNTACDLGREYQAAPPGSKQCCGKCVSVACVVEGATKNIGESWQSPDFCTTNTCVNLNGSLQVQSLTTDCEKVPQEVQENYEYILESVPGKCCKRHKILACKVGGEVYQVGRNWPSPDGDKCTKFICIKNNLGEITKKELTETCNKNCSKGSEYEESQTSCCGKCIPVACVVNGGLKYPGQNWTSADGCTTFSCVSTGGQFGVVSFQESCPNIDNCEPENIYTEGCCKHCNITIAPSLECIVRETASSDTVGLVISKSGQHGQCVNKTPIKGFTKCVGTCQSGTKFNPGTNLHDSLCKCCDATKYGSVLIDLECEDGFIIQKQVAVPSACNCESCGATATGTNSPVKDIRNISPPAV